ncbi:hypothetical protein HK098_004848 [Nowakowskiella sp. JEL0407]|nr:hypothetical protein HK098_004848 [Nowakowskiella sp. JEL0407]
MKSIFETDDSDVDIWKPLTNTTTPKKAKKPSTTSRTPAPKPKRKSTRTKPTASTTTTTTWIVDANNDSDENNSDADKTFVNSTPGGGSQGLDSLNLENSGFDSFFSSVLIPTEINFSMMTVDDDVLARTPSNQYYNWGNNGFVNGGVESVLERVRDMPGRTLGTFIDYKLSKRNGLEAAKEYEVALQNTHGLIYQALEEYRQEMKHECETHQKQLLKIIRQKEVQTEALNELCENVLGKTEKEIVMANELEQDVVSLVRERSRFMKKISNELSARAEASEQLKKTQLEMIREAHAASHETNEELNNFAPLKRSILVALDF